MHLASVKEHPMIDLTGSKNISLKTQVNNTRLAIAWRVVIVNISPLHWGGHRCVSVLISEEMDRIRSTHSVRS